MMETRERILEAASRVMRERGIAQATTKEIARAAGVAEGTLYNHFKNKSEMFLSVLKELPSPFMQRVLTLKTRVGESTVRENLRELARSALTFYETSIPMGASFFSEPELLRLHRAELRERGAGPQRANELLALYLRAEQEHGRLSAALDAETAAYMLLGACFQRAYWATFMGEPLTLNDTDFVRQLLDALPLA